MTILRRIILLAALGVAPFVANRPPSCHAAETNDLPHFQELFRLLRANLPEASDEELNRAAVQGLLDHFYPRVLLVTNTAAWLQNPEYAKTLAGWIQALTTGIPRFPPTWMFFWKTLLSTGLFTGLFVGAMKLSEKTEAQEAEAAEEDPQNQPEGAQTEESQA